MEEKEGLKAKEWRIGRKTRAKEKEREKAFEEAVDTTTTADGESQAA